MVLKIWSNGEKPIASADMNANFSSIKVNYATYTDTTEYSTTTNRTQSYTLNVVMAALTSNSQILKLKISFDSKDSDNSSFADVVPYINSLGEYGGVRRITNSYTTFSNSFVPYKLVVYPGSVSADTWQSGVASTNYLEASGASRPAYLTAVVYNDAISFYLVRTSGAGTVYMKNLKIEVWYVDYTT